MRRSHLQETSPKKTPKEFAEEHWKEIFAISGTLAGAVILLLIRYHRQRKLEEGDNSQDTHLDALEGEATSKRPDAVMLIETGVATKQYIQDSDTVITQLSKGLPMGKARKVMRVFRRVK